MSVTEVTKDCPRTDCRVTVSGGATTLLNYVPVYDKHGNNLNPDQNTTHYEYHCYSCSRKWSARVQAGKTTLTENV